MLTLSTFYVISMSPKTITRVLDRYNMLLKENEEQSWVISCIFLQVNDASVFFSSTFLKIMVK